MRTWRQGRDGAPTVSVIVVDWHEEDRTRACVESVLRSEVDAVVEIVVVENEAVAGAGASLAALHPDVRVVVEAGNSGFAGGVARGLAETSGPVVALVNNDARVDESFLARGLDRLRREGPDVAAVAGAVRLDGRYRRSEVGPLSDGTVRWLRDDADASSIELMNSRGIDATAAVNGYDRDWLRPVAEPAGAEGEPFGFSGAAVLLRRDAVDAVGGFAEPFFMYYEDLDLSWRLRLAGFRVVLEERAMVWHEHAASSGHSSPLMRRHGMRNRAATALRNGSPGLRARVVLRTALACLRDLLTAAAPGSRRPFLPPADWWWLWRTLPGVARHRTPADRERRRAVERLLRRAPAAGGPGSAVG